MNKGSGRLRLEGGGLGMEGRGRGREVSKLLLDGGGGEGWLMGGVRVGSPIRKKTGSL